MRGEIRVRRDLSGSMVDANGPSTLVRRASCFDERVGHRSARSINSPPINHYSRAARSKLVGMVFAQVRVRAADLASIKLRRLGSAPQEVYHSARIMRAPSPTRPPNTAITPRSQVERTDRNPNWPISRARGGEKCAARHTFRMCGGVVGLGASAIVPIVDSL